MAEYIKREDVTKLAKNISFEYEGAPALTLKPMIKLEDILKIPPADVVERKKGKWKTAYLDHEAFGVRPHTFYCSECQQITSFRTFYCPNCGADM